MQRIVTEITPYNEITVFETNQLFGKTGRFRCLRFADEAVQGAIDLRDPQRVVLEYPRALMHLMETNIPLFERIFMIGHGIGTLPSRYPNRSFTVAEIDERVAAVSRQYFHYDQSNVVIGDGREWLAKQETGAFNFIILDAFTQDGTPRHLTTLEFIRMARNRLRPQGVVLMNLAGRVRNDLPTASIHTTLAEAFLHTAAYFLPESPGAEIGNLLLAGCDEPLSADPGKMAGFRECTLERGYVLMDRPHEHRPS